MPEWQWVRLGEVLTRSREAVTLEPSEVYKQVTVRMRHKGVTLREQKRGSEIGTSRQYVARPGQFIISSIDARNGAMGLVPAELDGAIVTNDFWLFDADESRLNREWLRLYASTPDFVDACTGASEGSTNRVRLQPDRFLALDIPLPPLPEQRRIVARVQGMLAKVVEARGLKRESERLVAALQAAQAQDIFGTLAASYPLKSFGDMANHVTSGPRDWGSDYTDTGWRFYRAQDLTSEGRISEDRKAFVDESNDRPSVKLEVGDILIVITGATVGRCALFGDASEPGYISQHVSLCRLDKNIIDPEFAHRALLSPLGQTQLLGSRYGQGKPGLNLTQIRSLSIPVPPLDVQKTVLSKLRQYSKWNDHLRRLVADSQAELDALPASILARAFAGAL